MLAIAPCAEANWRSWALTPEADEIGMKRATGHAGIPSRRRPIDLLPIPLGQIEGQDPGVSTGCGVSDRLSVFRATG